jgi:FkbM family methyltransferase
MTMISYAQEGEDVLLQRAFPAGHAGFYIDVGASDPVFFSVTKHFYDRGWRGINIEPIPEVSRALRAQRPRDVNLNVGLSNREGRLTFYECPSVPSWSTFLDRRAVEIREHGLALRGYDVPVTTLAGVCERYAGGTIDFLKVDVEGFEREVLEGADWRRWRPRILLIENSWPGSWEHILLDAAYLLANHTEINRCYVREEDRDLLPSLLQPVNTGDDYVAHRHVLVLRQMAERLARGEDFGPHTLRVALWLHRAAARHPRLASAVRTILRAAG